MSFSLLQNAPGLGLAASRAAAVGVSDTQPPLPTRKTNASSRNAEGNASANWPWRLRDKRRRPKINNRIMRDPYCCATVDWWALPAEAPTESTAARTSETLGTLPREDRPAEKSATRSWPKHYPRFHSLHEAKTWRSLSIYRNRNPPPQGHKQLFKRRPCAIKQLTM